MHGYFRYFLFREIHIQDIFMVGRQRLEEEEKFWDEWIQYLLTLESDMDSRLLKEAREYCCDAETICEFAEKYYQFHPALYLYAIEAYMKETMKGH